MKMNSSEDEQHQHRETLSVLFSLVSSVISDLGPFLAVCKEPVQVRSDRRVGGNGPAWASSGLAL